MTDKPFDPWTELGEELNAEQGCDAISLWGDPSLSVPKHRVSTGSLVLDMALGGGLPSGRIIEVYGWEGIGKSTLCSHAGASAQAQGGFYVKLDSEVSGDRDRDLRIGVLPDRYFYVRCESVEKGFELFKAIVTKIRQYPQRLRAQAADMDEDDEEAKALLKKADTAENAPIVVAWDSIAASAVDEELANDKTEQVCEDQQADNKSGKKFGKKQGSGGGGMASKPRIIRKALRRLANFVGENNVVLIFVNHLIETLNAGYGPREITTGGHAIDFWASVQIKLKKRDRFVIRDRQVGIYVQAEVVKSKISCPKYECIYPLDFVHGVDTQYEAFDYLLAHKKYVSSAGGWYYVNDYPTPGENVSLRYADLHDHIKNDPKLFEFMCEKLRETFYGV